MEIQAASAGSAARNGTTTVGRIAVGLTTRPTRGSRELPNAAHLSHLLQLYVQEATSINLNIWSFTFGNSEYKVTFQFQYSQEYTLPIKGYSQPIKEKQKLAKTSHVAAEASREQPTYM
jgi:hypothetical protein